MGEQQDRLAEIRQRAYGLVEAATATPVPPPGDRTQRALLERLLMDADWLIGEVERLREIETDWNRIREELMNAKRANANLDQRLGLKLDELKAQDAEIVRLRGELRLARAVIHELVWGDIVITEHPRLRAALEAWGKADKIEDHPHAT